MLQEHGKTTTQNSMHTFLTAENRPTTHRHFVQCSFRHTINAPNSSVIVEVLRAWGTQSNYRTAERRAEYPAPALMLGLLL